MIDIPLNEIRIILALSMLSIATASDVKNREISDIIWVVFGAIGAILVVFSPDIVEGAIGIGISLIVAPIVLIIWRVGLFGGADAFALIALAVLAPNMTMSESAITPFTALTNAVVLSVVPMLVNVARNTIMIATGRKIFDGFDETASRKIAAMFIGYRASNPKFGFSIERSKGKQKKLKLSLQHAENTAFCSKADTWITPGIPYMIFITAGFVLQLIYGDILFSAFNLF